MDTFGDLGIQLGWSPKSMTAGTRAEHTQAHTCIYDVHTSTHTDMHARPRVYNAATRTHNADVHAHVHAVQIHRQSYTYRAEPFMHAHTYIEDSESDIHVTNTADSPTESNIHAHTLENHTVIYAYIHCRLSRSICAYNANTLTHIFSAPEKAETRQHASWRS